MSALPSLDEVLGRRPMHVAEEHYTATTVGGTTLYDLSGAAS